jgi:hypothetical protein
MLNDIPQPQFPVFFNAGTKAKWSELNKKADLLLGYSSEGAQTYSSPIISESGDYFFIVNQEVSELVDLTLCVEYDSIKLPQTKI